MKRMTHWMYREIVARGSRKRKQQQVARKSRRDLPPRENQSRKQISFIWSPFISCHTVTTDILPIYTTWSLFNFRWYQKETLTKRNLSKRGYEESIIYVILSARNLKKQTHFGSCWCRENEINHATYFSPRSRHTRTIVGSRSQSSRLTIIDTIVGH